MPILKDVDMSTVSTEREPLPEGEYLMTIMDQEFSEDERNLIIKRRIDEAPEEGVKLVGTEAWDWVNLVQNDGAKNEIGFQTIKKYLEAVFGKGSPESASNDTDPLNGHQLRQYIVQKTGKDGVNRNQVKRYIHV